MVILPLQTIGHGGSGSGLFLNSSSKIISTGAANINLITSSDVANGLRAISGAMILVRLL